MLTQKRIDEVSETDYSTITALTHPQIESLLAKDNIQMELFDNQSTIEVIDHQNKKIRYILCKNNHTMKSETETRQALITKVELELSQKANVKQKRDPIKVAASIGRLFERYRIEKFFTWDLDKVGKLSWCLKEDKVKHEQMLDGCYIIRTDSPIDILDKDEVVEGYRNLQKVEQAFKNLKTVSLEIRPMYHKTDERLKAHIFISTLAYYLQWNAMQRLKPLFDNDGQFKEKRWTFELIIERLKSIRITENVINGIVIKTVISQPDEEQQQILDLLGIKLK